MIDFLQNNRWLLIVVVVFATIALLLSSLGPMFLLF